MTNRKNNSQIRKNGFKIYRDSNRRIKNKVRKLESYTKKNPNDKQAQQALSKLKGDK